MSAPRKTQTTPRKRSAPTDTVYIYGLQDPESGEVRYVGQCRNLWQRMAGHLFNTGHGPARSKWLESLRARDLFPVFLVLEKTTAEQVYTRETYWIAYYTEHMGDLLNRALPTPYSLGEDTRTWKKTGAEFAEDTQEAIKRYAQTHGLQVREVWDMAARRFLAEVGGSADA